MIIMMMMMIIACQLMKCLCRCVNYDSFSCYLRFINTVELGYNDLGLCDTSVVLYILWCQLIPHKARVFLLSLVRHT